MTLETVYKRLSGDWEEIQARKLRLSSGGFIIVILQEKIGFRAPVELVEQGHIILTSFLFSLKNFAPLSFPSSLSSRFPYLQVGIVFRSRILSWGDTDTWPSEPLFVFFPQIQ